MSHSYSIIDGNCVEFSCIAAHLLYFLSYYLPYLMQVSMAWNELSE